MNFTNFLIERMLKTDYNKVLADPNIRCGVEYEFISTQISYDEFDEDELEDAYESYVADWVYFYKKVSGALREAVDEKRNELVQEVQEELDDLDEDAEDYTEDADYYNDRISELKEMSYSELLADIDDNAFMQDAVQNIESPSLPDMLHGYYEQQGTDVDEIMGNAVWDIINNATESLSEDDEGDRFITGEIKDILDQNQIRAPESVVASTEHDDIEEYLDIDDLPEFVQNNYCLGDIQACPTSKWRIDTDSSLPYGGVEIVSPILNLKDTLETAQGMFEYISEHGRTNSKTGLHVTMSSKVKTFPQADLLKLLMFIDEEFIYQLFPSRRNNQYAQQVERQLDYTGVFDSDQKYLQLMKSTAPAVNKEFQSLVKKTGDRFMGVNMMMTSNNPRIEFRYMGGAGYQNKFDQFAKLVMRFAYWLKLASDPEYKREEYKQRVKKLLMRGQKAVNYGEDFIYPAGLAKMNILYKPKSVKSKYQFIFAEKDGFVYKLQPTDGAKYIIVSKIPKAKFDAHKLKKQLKEAQRIVSIHDLLS